MRKALKQPEMFFPLLTRGDIIMLGRDPMKKEKRRAYEHPVANAKIQILLGVQDYLNKIPDQWYLTKGNKLELTSKVEIA